MPPQMVQICTWHSPLTNTKCFYFALSSSRVFTKVAGLRFQGTHLYPLLGDILIRASTQVMLHSATIHMLDLHQAYGFALDSLHKNSSHGGGNKHFCGKGVPITGQSPQDPKSDILVKCVWLTIVYCLQLLGLLVLCSGITSWASSHIS